MEGGVKKNRIVTGSLTNKKRRSYKVCESRKDKKGRKEGYAM